jgi:hypothetical protein
MPDPVVMAAMTIHPLMGIFWQSPVLLLAVFGWWAMRGPARAESWLSLAAIVTYIALISGYYEWAGGLSYTPRHLIPVLPLFAIPLAFLPSRWRPALWILAVISIVQHLIANTARLEYVVRLVAGTLDANHHPTAFFVSTIWSVCWPNLRHGLFLKNRGTLFMPEGFGTLVPLVIAEGVLVFVLYKWQASRESAAHRS